MKPAAILTGVLLLIGGLASSAGAEVSRWAVIPERSAITLSVRAFGMTQTGRFSRWSGDIRFDPSELRDAEVAISVEARSLAMRQPALTRQALGPGFLDAEHYPAIRFRLRSLDPVAPGRYTARAEVTVKDRSRPVVFPVNLSLDEGMARMTGGFVLDRQAYGIGGSSGLDGLIGREVRVDVALATRQTAS
jgi:polyisoprenoid-binding protein YceI